ncbi:ankyrin repeat domain-containing protein 60 isoform X2 [Phasianus colchicus]|uniref:ankyrin repeat domain-containing protein 60 isoform X2 n=1 Tax=Phasianus colchicus TaxID=9054 RepID=UPI00129D2E7F|nr:ankyrin repeat domain-containing protein 60 isoform X2 [Phasianus colchicus]
MPGSSSPLQTFSLQLRLAETNEIFSLPQCQNDFTLKQLKSDLELLTGIPFHFQRLHYLDEMDLPDDSTLMDNDVVPGGTITMRIWRQDGWGHLVAAAAKGHTMKLAQLGVTEEYAGTSPYAKILGPEQKKEWVAHRAFVALFVASHRGHVNTVKFLLSHGGECIWPISSDVDLKTIKTALANCNKFDIKVGKLRMENRNENFLLPCF